MRNEEGPETNPETEGSCATSTPPAARSGIYRFVMRFSPGDRRQAIL